MENNQSFLQVISVILSQEEQLGCEITLGYRRGGVFLTVYQEKRKKELAFIEGKRFSAKNPADAANKVSPFSDERYGVAI